MDSQRPRVLVLYHYMQPDDVISGVEFSELCAGLAAKGWDVVASSSNRAWGDERVKYPRRATWNGVEFRRVWRPGFRQDMTRGRLLNGVWMIVAWASLAWHPASHHGRTAKCCRCLHANAAECEQGLQARLVHAESTFQINDLRLRNGCISLISLVGTGDLNAGPPAPKGPVSFPSAPLPLAQS